MIVCFDGIAHILHPRLMKFHCSLQLRSLMEHAGHLAIEKVIENVSKGGLQIHSHGYTKGWRLFSWLALALEKGFEDGGVVLKGVGDGFELSRLPCLRQFQVAMERCDRWLEGFQVEGVLGLL